MWEGSMQSSQYHLLKIMSFPHYAFLLLLTLDMQAYFYGALSLQIDNFQFETQSIHKRNPECWLICHQVAVFTIMIRLTRLSKWIHECNWCEVSYLPGSYSIFHISASLLSYHPSSCFSVTMGASWSWSLSSFDLTLVIFENLVLGFQNDWAQGCWLPLLLGGY